MDDEQDLTHQLFTALGAIKKKPKQNLATSVTCERSRLRNRNELQVFGNGTIRPETESRSRSDVASRSKSETAARSNSQSKKKPDRRNFDNFKKFNMKEYENLQDTHISMARQTDKSNGRQNSFNHTVSKSEGVNSIPTQKNILRNSDKPKLKHFSNDYTQSYSSSKESNFSCGANDKCGMVAVCPEIGPQSNSLQGKSCENKNHAKKDNRKTPFIGYKKIEELLCKEPSNIVSYLSQNQKAFDEFLKRDKSSDLMLLTMTLIAKICSCNFMENKASLLFRICDQDYIDQLCKFFAQLPAEKDQVRKSKINVFFDEVIEFYDSIVNLFPEKAHEILQNMFIITNVAVHGVERYQKLDLTVQKNKLENLETQLKHIEEDLKKKSNVPEKVLEVGNPPNDFREMSICPTKDDLFDEPFLRENIVRGRYNDVDHYLDIQFRLLREDFVGPLREGILAYKDMVHERQGKWKRIENIKVYPNAAFVQTTVSGDRVNYVVNFDPIGRYKKLNWTYSKRFMFGSLLCFTNDNFNSIFFGTVADRDLKQLEAGRVTVQLEGRADCNIFSGQFIMVESEAYFESYYHVLKALQKMTFNSFPMMKYIIAGDVNPITPNYLLNKENLEYVIGNFIVRVLMESHWPTHVELKLDESQHRAFKAALTNEFVVIQGPPGTGKTFLGLKIAKTLLENRRVWNSHHTPLVVIAYTNHALDQFLEGILQYTDKLIRIGGQSKCSALEKYTLKEARKNMKFHKSHSFDLYKHLFHEMIEAMREIKSLQANIDYVMKKSGVLPVSVLQSGGISDEQLKSSFYIVDNINGNWNLLEDWYKNWLLGDFEVQDDEAEMDKCVLPDEKVVEVPLVEEDDEHDRHNRLLNYIDDSEDFNFQFTSTDCCIVKLHALEMQMKNAYFDYENTDPGDVMERTVKQRNFNCSLQTYRFWKEKLENCQVPSEERVRRLLCIRNLWDLSFDDRWALYWHGWSKLHLSLLKKMSELEMHYEDIYRKHQEARQMADLDIMRMADVVGLTTSGAARLQSQLVELKPKIVIVEEAAEVLESHIVVSLTKNCEHVILIGDHQQLRPSTSVFKLARQYKFDISLFERMICLGMECNTLQVQHRMRPEIASLICPTIYPRLINHKSVCEYEHIKGVEKSLYFIDHNEPEEFEAERDSRKNTFEADFLISLCRYLLLQGYEGSEITILTTYSGQMLYMRQKWKQLGLSKDVRISVVDNFQGEENKIILLSLVRSNSEANIGFLKIENRVCVALSRAKQGFYMIGNMDNLSSSSKIWPKIKETLLNKNALGHSLTLRCQNHLQLTQVKCSSDFSRVPEGGCLLRCNSILNCGHQCTSICHVQIERHARCFLPCERIPLLCPEGHPCTKKCFEECGKCLTKVNKMLPCGHKCVLECNVDISLYKCKEVEEVLLPACSHKNPKLCFTSLENVICQHECIGRLDCGHSCIKLCHVKEDPDHEQYKCSKPCAKKNEGCKENHICTKLCFEECGKCLIDVKISLPDCGHVHKLKCSEDLSQFKCFRRCKRTMQCGHPCKMMCCAPCGNCKVKVVKAIPDCGHTINLECSVQPELKHCKNSCERTLPCGHKCKTSCRLPCTVECLELVPSRVRPACGHGIEIPCYMIQQDLQPHSMELLAHCQVPCGMELQCGHKCRGTCGSCWQGRLHIQCKEKCGRQNICNHYCEVPCANVCPPCTKKCEYRCKHSRCLKKCCVPCTPCKELCKWRCKHLKCTKYCSEICDREPCYEPCEKFLKCGHPCVGFCGEPCPRLCRTCDMEELTTIFLGHEDQDDARFIFLTDCKHIIESQGLDEWMKQNGAVVSIKTCPKCKTPITRTARFMNDLKKVYQDVLKIKKKMFGNTNEAALKKMELATKLSTINIKGINVGATNELINMLYEDLNSRQNSINNVPSLADLHVIEIKANFLDNALNSILEYKREANGLCKKELEEKFNLLLSVLLTKDAKMPPQRVSDFECELKRFHRFSQLCMLKDCVEFRNVPSCNRTVLTEPVRNAENIIRTIVKYSDAIDEDAKRALDLIRTKLMIARRLTDLEMRTIINATQVHKGHWYKCPNGHLYCVGECGRPMEMSTCPECKARIGGEQHRLLTTNEQAYLT